MKVHTLYDQEIFLLCTLYLRKMTVFIQKQISAIMLVRIIIPKWKQFLSLPTGTYKIDGSVVVQKSNIHSPWRTWHIEQYFVVFINCYTLSINYILDVTLRKRNQILLLSIWTHYILCNIHEPTLVIGVWICLALREGSEYQLGVSLRIHSVMLKLTHTLIWMVRPQGYTHITVICWLLEHYSPNWRSPNLLFTMTQCLHVTDSHLPYRTDTCRKFHPWTKQSIILFWVSLELDTLFALYLKCLCICICVYKCVCKNAYRGQKTISDA